MKADSGRRRFPWQAGLLVALAALLAWGVGQCVGPLRSGGPTVTETVTGGWIVVYFTSPQHSDGTGSFAGGIDAELAALIDSAEQNVDLAAYALDLDSVTDALVAAHGRGVQVRVVTDESNAAEAAILRLREARIPVVARPEGAWGIMHHKFVVVDGAWLWTGSMNLTANGVYRNNNNAVLIASRLLAESYSREFEEMFSGRFGPSSPADTPYPDVEIQTNGSAVRVHVCFSPEDGAADPILQALSTARSSVRFLAYQFTSDALAQALIGLAADGVQVEGVVEARSAFDSYSQTTRLREGGVAVLTDGNPYLMHHKVFIIDDHIVILGSYNFTASAEDSNDENVLIIDDPAVATAFLAEYERIRAQALAASD